MLEECKTSSKKIQVGRTKVRTKVPGTQKKKIATCKYSDVPIDKLTGFVNDLTYLPINYDMMIVKLKDKRRKISAWWDGKNWIGLRLKPEDEIIAWKRVQYCAY
jgi:hypothetical protein